MESILGIEYKKNNYTVAYNYLIDEDISKFKKSIKQFLCPSDCEINGQNLLNSAAIYGSLEACISLVKKFPELLFFQDKLGNTALHWAARYGYSDICEFLIESGADALVNNNNNQSAFYIALDYYKNYLKKNSNTIFSKSKFGVELENRRKSFLSFLKDPMVIDKIMRLLCTQ